MHKCYTVEPYERQAKQNEKYDEKTEGLEPGLRLA